MNTLESMAVDKTFAELEQENILDVLMSHKLLGSPEWIFPAEARTDLEELHDMGLVYFVAGPVSGSYVACLTELGINLMNASYQRIP